MTKNTRKRGSQKIMLRACPRCQGDLFPDFEEEDFACLQCGRRIAPAQLMAALRGETQEPAVAQAA